MTDPAFIIVFALLFVFSIYIGFLVGTALGERVVTTRGYWLGNLGAMAVCVVVSLLVAALPMLYAIDLGLLVGCIAGLKMGFGESTGPWKVLDRFFNVNRAHREAARTGAGEARRRRRRNHEKAPDLISVAGPAAPREDGHAHTTKRNG